MSPVARDVSAALVAGLAEGAVFALLAAALVLIWRVQRHVNLAVAEHAGAAALGLHLLHVVLGVPYVYAAIVAVALAVGLALGVERVVVRPLLARSAPDPGRARPGATDAARAATWTVPAATAGVALLVIAATEAVTDGGWASVPPLLPADVLTGGAVALVTPQHLFVVAALLAGAVGLWVLGRTASGVLLSAVAADRWSARLVGLPSERADLLAWGVAGGLAGLAGVAFVPLAELRPGLFTVSALVPALAAALVGRGRRLVPAMAVAVLLGCLGQLLGLVLPVVVPDPGLVLGTALLLLALLVVPRPDRASAT